MNFRAVVALLAVSVLVGCGAMPQSGQLFNNTTAKPSPAPAVGTTTTSVPATPQGAPVAKQVAVVAPEALVQKTKAKGTAKAALPMARKGEITSPKVLAERIRETLKADPTGNKKLVRGANTTPAGFLASVQAAGGTVDGLAALPAYLESLVARDMPSGKFTMSRVIYSVASGTEKYQLDIERGFAREAHKGEQGWYDANTGRLILAGDCSNSPLGLVKGPTAPQPAPAPAPAPSPRASACTSATKIGEVMVWWQDVVGKVAGLDNAIAKVRAGRSGYYDPEEVSRGFGARIRASGTPAPSADVVTVKLHRTSGGVTELFRGSVDGKRRFELPADAVDADVVQIVFDGLDKYVYPPRDLRGKVSEYKGGCVINASHAILR